MWTEVTSYVYLYFTYYASCLGNLSGVGCPVCQCIPGLCNSAQCFIRQLQVWPRLGGVRAEARPGERERPPVGREAVKPADWSQTQSHSSESGQLRLRLRPQCINCKEFLWKCNFNRDSFVVHHLWNLKSWIMQHNTRVQKSLRVKQVLASPSQLTLKLSSIPEYYPRYIFSIAQIVSFFCYVNSFY